MSATKSRRKSVVQRVAKHLILRDGRYTYRRNIPQDVRHAFGGVSEYVRSLGDVSEARAKTLAAVHREFCDQRIEEAREGTRGQKKVTDFFRVKHVPDVGEVDRAIRAWVIQRETDASAHPVKGRQAVSDRTEELIFRQEEVRRSAQSGSGEFPLMTQWIAESLVDAQGWIIPPDSPLKDIIEERIARGQRELASRLKADLTWEGVSNPTHRMFSADQFALDERNKEVSAPRRAIPIMDVFEGYLAEQQPAPSTVKAWKSALKSLTAHLGHSDAARVTPDDIVSWKNALLVPSEGEGSARGQMTVRHKYLGAVKPVFGWAVANRLIETNPVVGVRVAVPRRIRTRAEKGYSDSEAKIVLRAALAVDCFEDQSFTAFARRWLPWLCAYTGARAGEIAQLRRQDVKRSEDGIWFIKITPEAGRQKGGLTRHVAIHPHLIDQGFIAAIRERSGPLFYDPSKRREGSTGNPQYKKVAQRVSDWVRSLGVIDTELQPNHGWRHRFITIARDIGIDPDIRRAITAHAAKDEHQDYGDVLVRSSSRALAAFPRYEWPEDNLRLDAPSI